MHLFIILITITTNYKYCLDKIVIDHFSRNTIRWPNVDPPSATLAEYRLNYWSWQNLARLTTLIIIILKPVFLLFCFFIILKTFEPNYSWNRNAWAKLDNCVVIASIRWPTIEPQLANISGNEPFALKISLMTEKVKTLHFDRIIKQDWVFKLVC